MEYSVSPDGKKFKIPDEKDYKEEYERIEKIAEEKRKEGFEIVVVMGLGFVGAVMAGVVADSVDEKTGKPGKFVIGMQRPSTRSFWKIPLFNLGISPVKAEDPDVAPMILMFNIGGSLKNRIHIPQPAKAGPAFSVTRSIWENSA